ncbi:MAG TPA: hypothetical protein PLI77_05480 [Bacteroidales bacterium]|nr:hypothetical protein [Bacteroidales bacterium]
MNKIKFFFTLTILFFTSCQNHKDRIVCEVFNQKLYESVVIQNIPSGLNPEDSLEMFQTYVTSWLKEQILLHEANKVLSISEKSFDDKIRKYREHLLIEAYFNKMTQDSLKFLVSDQELKHFIGEYKESEPIQKNVVRVNYVKLSKNSKVGNSIKEILFDDVKRIHEKNKLVTLCSDSLEYFLDDNQWILLDYLENDFPFSINIKDQLLRDHKKMDVSDDYYRYIIVFLDFKTQYTSHESDEEQNSLRNLLIQQKKVNYINKLKESLYKKAIQEDKIIQ